MSKKSDKSNEFNLLNDKNLDEELKEITIFFDQVGSVKERILNEKVSKYKDKEFLKDDQILELLYGNVNLFNVITDDTVKVYIETFFERRTSEHANEYKFTEVSLETFLTSILIFAQD